MAQKIQKKYALNIQGIINIDDDGHITVLIEDKGEFDLAELMSAFDGNECKIAVSHAEDYGVDANEETGEVI